MGILTMYQVKKNGVKLKILTQIKATYTSHFEQKLNSSKIWNNVLLGWPISKQGIHWRVRNLSLSLTTVSLKIAPYGNLIQGPLTKEHESLKFYDDLDKNCWNFQRLSLHILRNLQKIVTLSPVQIDREKQDNYFRKYTSNGIFLQNQLTILFYALLIILATTSFKAIWSTITQKKIKTFLSLCAHDRIPSKLNLNWRNI